MSWSQKFINISNKLYVKTKCLKSITIEKQREYLKHFNTPKNDIERSYFQHKCRVYKDDIFLIYTIKNLISLIILPIYYITISIRTGQKKQEEQEEHENVVLIYNGPRKDFIPSNFLNNYICCGMANKMLLTKDDKFFLKRVYKRYPFAFYFQLRVLLKIASYSYIIKKYNPIKILCSCEYSGTSSIMTYYCEQKHIEHINLMHGEIVFNIVNAFCRFTKFYIWDLHYKRLMIQLKADKNNFIQYTPELLKFNCSKYNKKIDYKFYLQLETKETLYEIKNSIEIFKKYNYKVMLRPHPIYTNQKLLYHLFPKDLIENSDEVSIEQSICEAKNVIARNSTVLLQAHFNKINAVIDDISNPTEFKETQNSQYIMLEKPHELLSQILMKISKEKLN